jgi:RNA polymerase sigma-70 factor (ECF subfamily)
MVGVVSEEDGATLVSDLFEQHKSAVFAYILRLTSDGGLAEELTQETFLRVFEARSRLQRVANLRAWVFRVATNTTFSALRRRRLYVWLPWEDTDRAAARTTDAAESVGLKDAIEQALSSLAPHYRAPLLLFSYYGFSVAETAAILGISEGAVKTRVYRAKEMFQQAYGRGERR